MSQPKWPSPVLHPLQRRKLKAQRQRQQLVVARNSLARYGLTPQDAATMTDEELLRIAGIGPKSVRLLRAAIDNA